MAQVQVRYFLHDFHWLRGNTEGYLALLPAVQAAEVGQFTHFKGYFNALAGKLLLRLAILEEQESLAKLAEIQSGPHGKPFHSELFHFNVTHTKGLVAIAWSYDLPVGLDSEALRKKDPFLFTKQFNSSEMEAFRKDPDPTRAFFKRWTQKEAIVKEIGDGLTLPLREITENPADVFNFRNRIWHTREIRVSDNHYVHLATQEEIELHAHAVEL